MRVLTITAVISVIILVYVFRMEIEDWVECQAYYDQCTADRVDGLTREECFARDDNVAYLLDNGICLVRPSLATLQNN